MTFYFSGRLVTMTPCRIAISSVVGDLQNNHGERVANDRTDIDSEYLPYALLYYDFGLFMDCPSANSTDTTYSINKREFEKKFDNFMTASAVITHLVRTNNAPHCLSWIAVL